MCYSNYLLTVREYVPLHTLHTYIHTYSRYTHCTHICMHCCVLLLAYLYFLSVPHNIRRKHWTIGGLLPHCGPSQPLALGIRTLQYVCRYILRTCSFNASIAYIHMYVYLTIFPTLKPLALLTMPSRNLALSST